MLRIDFRNAVEVPKTNKYTCSLFRLMLKADGRNLSRLGMGFPIPSRMVWIYRMDCPYKDEKRTKVDWDEIERKATEEVLDV